jgi:O-antigen ligase
LSDLLAGAGLLIAAGAAAAAILVAPGRRRAVALVVALVLCPVLILADQWDTPQIADLRDDPAYFAGLSLLATAIAATLATIFRRWPIALPLAIVFALPFRVPLESGGDTANLLVPLYLVIAGGVLTTALRDWVVSPGGPPTTEPAGRAAQWLPRALAAVVVLYALQTLYSPDFSKSLQYACFFFVPFSLLYALLREVEWDRRLLTLVLALVAIEGVVFVAVGSVEYLSESLFWNDQVIRSNEFHTYFRVNSVFWDPNIYGRYLALAIVIATTALLWARDQRWTAVLTGLIAVLWIGLVPTFSQSSFAALLAGLAVLAALRWSVRWTLAAVGAAAVLGIAVVIFAGGVSKLNPTRINIDTGGRADLVSGGLDLFAQRPVWGYGAGSFPRAYREHIATRKAPVSVSHTQPVTVAAEQGVIGIAAYAALLAVALGTMGSGLWRKPEVGRAAVLAAFVALLVHTMAYAGFFEDPIAWLLLAVGASLGAAAVRDAA